MITLLRVSKTIIRRLSSNSAEKIESIAGSLYKGQLSTRILSYPVSDAHTDVAFAKMNVLHPVASDVRDWSQYYIMENSGLWEKLNSHCKIHDDHSLFLSGFVGPRPVSLSGQNTPLGEWAHCKSAAQNRRNALTYKEMEDDKMLITGIENFVLNASKADHFVVWAYDENSDELRAFLVPRDSKGLTIGNESKLTIVSSLEGRKVSFHQVEGMFLGEGHDLYRQMISREHRIYQSARVLGKVTKLFNLTLKHASQKKEFNKPLSEINIIQSKLSRVSGLIYGLQSTLYLVSGLADSEPIDFELDSALLQILAEFISFEVMKECTSIFGYHGLLKGSQVDEMLNDITFTYFHSDFSIDVTKVYTSLMGIQGLGREIGDSIKLRRKAREYPMEAIKELYNQSKIAKSRLKKKKTLALSDYVNYQFKDATNDLEDYILDFRFLLDASLLTHGRNIQLEEEELSRMAEYASELLAIISIISRLNLLSTTPGGYKKDYEKCLGYSYMRDAFIRLKFLKERLGKESHTNNDKNLRDAGDYILDQSKYPCVHPITKNRF
uniref:AcylCoA dehydrogenase family member 9, mitochondriallike [Callithrix jacchus] n=1 Tax=Lepeophtheirus salmonis TaxID=72036 RepID=A0A0K2UVA4_LEPSM